MTRNNVLAIGIVAVAMGVGTTAVLLRNKGGDHALAQGPSEGDKGVQVKVIRPRTGALERLCIQPGSVHSFESIQLFARVPGFLKYQRVDIDDPVKKGETLAIVDVPDLEAQVERNKAAVEKTESQLAQMKAHVDVAYANLDAAQAGVIQAEATAKSAAAWVKYRVIQLGRMDALVKANAIEFVLYDESKERHDASVESENAAKAAVITSKAKVVASKAKIEQAKADVVEAEAEIRVAKAELKKANVNLDFATITAPFDGVVTYRSMNPGDFVRGANAGAANNPLLTVQRTDKFRVVVLVPDRDVKYIKKGKPAEIEIDALPGRKFSAKVSRMAHSLDQQTRLMRVEIDLLNPDGEIYHGMYGQVTITLEKGENLLSIPTPCIVGKIEEGMASVYVVRAGRPQKVSIDVGMDSGLRVAVLKGLSKDDQVILNPSSDLSQQTEVIPTLWDDAKRP